MMRFPLLQGSKSVFRANFKCTWCKQGKVCEPHSFAYIGGGAMLMDKKRENGGPDDRLDGFFDLVWHGAHTEYGGQGEDPDIREYVDIARDVRGGQFDIYFCSTKCMRAFFNHAEDRLEKKVSNEK